MGTEAAKAIYQRYGWTARLRPMVVGAFVADLLVPERRTIIENDSGFRFFADPLSNLGEELIKAKTYEPETEQIFRNHLFENDSFLDVGANEGYFSVLAASIVGPGGYVSAVEPQSRLCEIIEINLGLNGVQGKVSNAALGGAKGDHCELYLYPSLNTGAASVVRKPRLYRSVETSVFVDPADLLGSRDSFSFAKVDVEGYEDNVVRCLLPLLKAGKIQTMLVDYHASILHARGVDPATIELMIVGAGMRAIGDRGSFSGYRLYSRN